MKIEDYFLTEERGKIYEKAIEDTERRVIEKALERTFGNQIKAAKILGINRNTLHAKISRFKIHVEKFKI